MMAIDIFRLPAPFSTLVSILLLAGVLGLGRRFGKRAGQRLKLDDSSTAMVLVGLSIFAYSIISLGFYPLEILRITGIAIAMVGIAAMPTLIKEIKVPTSWHHRLLWVLYSLTFLVCLSPPSEADELVYHLPIPIQWLQRGGLFNDPWDLHLRLGGLGEALSALGLAAGSDTFGHLLSFLGLMLCINAARTISRLLGCSVAGERVTVLAIFSAPFLVAIVPTAKAQVFPASLVLLGLAEITKKIHSGTLSLSDKGGYTIGIFFGAAIAFKLSLLIPITAIGLAMLLFSSQAFFQRIIAVSKMAISSLVVAIPYWLTCFLSYGDPIPPIGAKFMELEPRFIAFEAYIRTLGGEKTFLNIIRVPWRFSVPTNLGEASLTAGPFLMVVILPLAVFVLFKSRTNQVRRFAAITFNLMMALSVGLGQLYPRFFLCPLVLAASLSSVTSLVENRWFRMVASLATIPVMAGFLIGVLTLSPGALSEPLRKAALSNHAFGYDPWLKASEFLPPDAVVLTNISSQLFATREQTYTGPFHNVLPKVKRSYHKANNWDQVRESELQAFLQEMRNRKVTHYLRLGNDQEEFILPESVLETSFQAKAASRVPFRSQTVKMEIWSLSP